MKNKIILIALALANFNAFAAEPGPDPSEPKQQLPISYTLGWVTNPKLQTICQGYFYDSFLGMVAPNLNAAAVKITADSSVLHQTGGSVLAGHVSISQPAREITAGKAYVDYDQSQGLIKLIKLENHISLHEPGKYIVGQSGLVNYETKYIRINDAIYRIAFGKTHATKSHHLEAESTAWGRAGELERTADDMVTLHNGTYSTCAPDDPTWEIASSKIELNRETGRGVAKNATIRFKDFPVFYWPYFNFPIDKRRQSGFLMPTQSNSSMTLYSVGLPYYWNIAPNIDDTFTPIYYQLDGLQYNNVFRYLTKSSRGDIFISILPHDRNFADFKPRAQQEYVGYPSYGSIDSLMDASLDRRAISWQHSSVFDDNWSGSFNYNYVSDDYFFYFFNNLSFPGVSVPNQLPQQGDIYYQGSNWNFKAEVLNYLTLHPVNYALISNQYARMPEFALNGSIWKAQDFNLGLDSQFVHFQEDRNPGATTAPPDGDRLNFQPGFDYTLAKSWGYVRPNLQLMWTQYDISGLVQADGNNYYPHYLSRFLPIVNLDASLFYDRAMNYSLKNFRQTLEPRIYYLYVPYANQNEIPEFDTSLQPFNYNQLFVNNRFNGIDRVGDANQLSVGVTTRFLNNLTGEEKFNASIGQIYYFQNRKITLCTTPGCTDTESIPGATSNSSVVSPITGMMQYHINPAWSGNASVAFNPFGEVNNMSLFFTFHPALSKVANIGYNYLRLGDVIPNSSTAPPPSGSVNDFNQVSASFSWPLQERWQFFSSLTYNISKVHAQTYLYGLEYNSCCWAIRLVGGNTFNSLTASNSPEYNTQFYLQVHLKGLGNIGSNNVSNFLASNIPGFHDNFGKGS